MITKTNYTYFELLSELVNKFESNKGWYQYFADQAKSFLISHDQCTTGITITSDYCEISLKLGSTKSYMSIVVISLESGEVLLEGEDLDGGLFGFVFQHYSDWYFERRKNTE